MIESTRIASTPLLNLRPLGTPGDRSYERLTDFLREKLGPRHAALLAEPIASVDGTRIDWYVPGAAEAITVIALDERKKQDVLRTCNELTNDILTLAQKFASSAVSADRAIATALINAMKIPEQSCLLSVNGKPVLIAWAHRHDDASQSIGGTVSTLFGRALAAQSLQSVPVSEQQDAVESENGSRDQPPFSGKPIGSPDPSHHIKKQSKPLVAHTDAHDQFPPQIERAHVPSWLYFLPWIPAALTAVAIIWLLLLPCAGTSIGPFTFHPPFVTGCAPAMASSVAGQDGSGAQSELDQQKRRTLDLTKELSQIEPRYRDFADRCEASIKSPQTPSATPPASAPDVITDVKPVNGPVADPESAPKLNTGPMQVTLLWQGHADLDLVIGCGDQEISFKAKEACGASLDVDANSTVPFRDNPVENIFWPNSPRAGTYDINIGLYDRHGESRPTIPFTVRIRRNGKEESFTGSISVEKRLQLLRKIEIDSSASP